MAVDTAATVYLRTTMDVLRAGEWLHEVAALNDEDAVDDAVRRLERAADAHEGENARFQARGFSALEAAPDAADSADEVESLISNITAELDVANVLLAAGQTLGEAGSSGGGAELEAALEQLRERTRALEGGSEPERLGFFGARSAVATPASADAPSAAAAFRAEIEDALTSFVAGAADVTASVVEELKQLDRANVRGALTKLGGKLAAPPAVGRLLRRGLRKLEQALNALIRLVGSDALARVRDRVAELWDKATDGAEPLPAALGWAFGVDDARAEVERVLASPDLEPQALDRATAAVVELHDRFKRNMDSLRQAVRALAAALAVAAVVALVVAPIAPYVPLAAVTGYAVVLGVVLLLGLDYADSGGWLGRVDGVRSVARGLAG